MLSIIWSFVTPVVCKLSMSVQCEAAVLVYGWLQVRNQCLVLARMNEKFECRVTENNSLLSDILRAALAHTNVGETINAEVK